MKGRKIKTKERKGKKEGKKLKKDKGNMKRKAKKKKMIKKRKYWMIEIDRLTLTLLASIMSKNLGLELARRKDTVLYSDVKSTILICWQVKAR